MGKGSTGRYCWNKERKAGHRCNDRDSGLNYTGPLPKTPWRGCQTPCFWRWGEESTGDPVLVFSHVWKKYTGFKVWSHRCHQGGHWSCLNAIERQCFALKHEVRCCTLCIQYLMLLKLETYVTYCIANTNVTDAFNTGCNLLLHLQQKVAWSSTYNSCTRVKICGCNTLLNE